jgi:hypothetical protein
VGSENMNKTIQVRVLFTEGCPNVSPTIDLIEKVGKNLGLAVVMDKVLVTSHQQAVELRCLGSPTVQINSIDIDPEARESIAFGLG